MSCVYSNSTFALQQIQNEKDEHEQRYYQRQKQKQKQQPQLNDDNNNNGDNENTSYCDYLLNSDMSSNSSSAKSTFGGEAYLKPGVVPDYETERLRLTIELIVSLSVIWYTIYMIHFGKVGFGIVGGVDSRISKNQKASQGGKNDNTSNNDEEPIPSLIEEDKGITGNNNNKGNKKNNNKTTRNRKTTRGGGGEGKNSNIKRSVLKSMSSETTDV